MPACVDVRSGSAGMFAAPLPSISCGEYRSFESPKTSCGSLSCCSLIVEEGNVNKQQTVTQKYKIDRQFMKKNGLLL